MIVQMENIVYVYYNVWKHGIVTKKSCILYDIIYYIVPDGKW